MRKTDKCYYFKKQIYRTSLDFIDSITEKDLPIANEPIANGEKEFFALAGLWAGRDISLQSIREQAWPYRA